MDDNDFVERRKGGVRRAQDHDRLSVIKLWLTVAIALTPIVAGLLVLYGDIRVLSADLKNERERSSEFEIFVRNRDPLAGSELRQLMTNIQQAIHALQFEVQECKE